MTPLIFYKADTTVEFADVLYVRLPDDLRYVLKKCHKHRGIVGFQFDPRSDGIAILLEQGEPDTNGRLDNTDRK